MWTRDSGMMLAHGVTLTESNGEVLFFDEANEQVFGVDGPAAEALMLLHAGKTVGVALRALLDVYDVEPSVLERDVGAVLEAMTVRRLLQPVACDSDPTGPIVQDLHPTS